MSRLGSWAAAWFAALLILGNGPPGMRAETALFAIGGGLRPDNSAVFQRLIAAGGGVGHCRVAIFTTASVSVASAELLRNAFTRQGVAANDLFVLDIRR